MIQKLMVLSFSYFYQNRWIKKNNYMINSHKDVDGFHPEKFWKNGTQKWYIFTSYTFGILIIRTLQH